MQKQQFGTFDIAGCKQCFQGSLYINFSFLALSVLKYISLIFNIYCALKLFDLEFHVTHFEVTPTHGPLTIPVDLAQINNFDI